MHTDEVMKRLPDLTKSFVETVSLAWLEPISGQPSHVGDLSRDSPLWLGTLDLFLRVWPRRLWTLQEVSIARDVYVHCGSKILSWESVKSFATSITESEWHRLAASQSREILTNFFLGLGAFATRRRAFVQRKDSTLFRLCYFGIQKNETSDPVDKVYAVLGLVNPSIRREFHIDYSERARREYWDLYMRFGHVMLAEDNHLAILHLASWTTRLDNLPSWCPKFNSHTINAPTHYRVIAEDRQHTNRPTHVATAIDRRRLVLRGRIVDRVCGIASLPFTESPFQTNPDKVDRPTESVHALECISAALQLWSSINAHSETNLEETLLRTMIQNKLLHRERWNPNLDGILGKIAVCAESATSEGRPSTGDQRADADRDSATAYLNAMRACCTQRSFFCTEQGRCGIGATDTKVNDDVCLFEGTWSPLVLRHVQDDVFTLIGDTYMHGPMDGKVFNPSAFGPGQERVFWLA